MLRHIHAGEKTYLDIDHIAIAVRDIEIGLNFFCDVLGFDLLKRYEVAGRATGMALAELRHNGLKFVLCQGLEPESQVSRLIESYGPGVAHIALSVDDVAKTAERLEARGLAFETPVIAGPGLTQIFSERDPNSGLSFELIERTGEEGFSPDNIQTLFNELERSGNY